MPKSHDPVPELIRVSEALESQLASLEASSKELRKARLNSEKNITRAAKELTAMLTLPEQLAEGLHALAAAMGRIQERQQAALEPLAAFAVQLQQRMQRLTDHGQALAALGSAAGELTEQLQAAGGDPPTALFTEVQTRLGGIAEGARALFEAARADDFPDVAREADALGQRITALRKRLERS